MSRLTQPASPWEYLCPPPPRRGVGHNVPSQGCSLAHQRRVRPAAATEAIDIQFTTGHKPPDLVVRYPISVLEQHVETHMPLEVLNLDAVHVQYETLTTKNPQAE